MKKLILLFSFSLSLILAGCVDSFKNDISESEVKEIVIKKYANEIGTVEIESVTKNKKEYIVEWKNEKNCQTGKEYINTKTGESIKGELTIC